MNIPNIDLPRVVVIGAGFAGLQIAKNINTNHYQLVLLDRNNYHTFQPLLYQVASTGLEPDSIAYPIRKTLGDQKHSFYRLASVDHIDTEESVVHTNIGTLTYDILVIATGAGNNFFNNKTIEANALPMKSITDALSLRSKILGNFEKAINTNDLSYREELMNFVIVGAGPTGVELAGALAELRNKVLPKDYPDLDFRRMSINLIEAAPRVLASMSESSSEKAHNYLKKMGVYIWTDTYVQDYKDNVVVTNGKTNFKADTLIWAAGVLGHFPEGVDVAHVGKGHRIVTDEFCKMQGLDHVYALGDVALTVSEAHPNGLPMLGAVAMQQGKYLAQQLNRKAKGKTIQPFAYKDKGTMATIGRNRAVVELGRFKFQGAMAWLVWMFVHLMLLVGYRNRVVVFVNWAWNYVRFNNSLRLIVRPYKKKPQTL
ncbi:MAG: NAD(P)/FAD-dependent oxidoreductase [Bacteroidota bacterium]